SIINTSSDGKAEELSTLENLVDDPKGLTKALGEAWEKHSDFMLNWFSLEPKLAGADLRPLVYLSRETVPLRASRAGLSAGASDALDVLRTTSSSSSPAGRKADASVPRNEADTVMAALIDGMRTHPDWNSRPSEFYGALLLAEASIDAGAQLSAFLHAAAPNAPAWLKVAVKNKA